MHQELTRPIASRTVESDHSKTRQVYDSTAGRYIEAIGTTIGPATETDFDRGLLRSVVRSMISRTSTGPTTSPLIADLGCGPGRVGAVVIDEARRLHLPADVIGIDISGRLLAEAQASHPSVAFAFATIARLPLASASVDGAVAWYSIIHTSLDAAGAVAGELARVLKPGAQALLAFQCGDGQRVENRDAYGSGHPLTSFRHDLDAVAELLTGAGLVIAAKASRPAQLSHESTRQGFVLASRPDQ